MATHTGTIEAISYKYDKFAVLIEEAWYGTKAEYAAEWPVKPSVGDSISWDDGGKKYLGKMKILKSGGGSAGLVAGKAAGGSGGYSSLGVEVGHASNLAMRVMEQYQFGDAAGSMPTGSVEYYKQFVKETETIYKLMKGLKTKLGAPVVAAHKSVETAVTVETPKAEVSEEVADDLADLF